MSTKKTAPKKRTKKPTQLDRIERKLDLLDTRLRTIKSFETLQEAMEEHKIDLRIDQPKEAEQEKRVPNMGEWVVCDRSHEGDKDGPTWVGAMGALVGVPMKIDCLDHAGLPMSDGWAWDPSWLRPATPSEVEAHQQKEKISKLKFGTPVNTPDGEGLYLYTDEDGDHWVVRLDGNSFYYNIHDITIL